MCGAVWDTLNDDQRLLLALHSGIPPFGAPGTIWDTGGQTWVGLGQGNHFISYTVASVPCHAFYEFTGVTFIYSMGFLAPHLYFMLVHMTGMKV